MPRKKTKKYYEYLTQKEIRKINLSPSEIALQELNDLLDADIMKDKERLRQLKKAN